MPLKLLLKFPQYNAIYKQTIIALGADAVSKVVFLEDNRIERFGNVKDIKEYANRIKEMVEEKKKLLDTLYLK